MATVSTPDLAKLPWHGPAPAPCHSAAHGARWPTADWRNSPPASPPGPYSTCPSSAGAGGPPPAAEPPPRAATLRGEKWERVFVVFLEDAKEQFVNFECRTERRNEIRSEGRKICKKIKPEIT